MFIVLCNGGLGNQTFQYIFARYLELTTGEIVYLDDSAFWGDNVAHNGFEIPRVFPNSKVRLLSDFFSEDVWEYMLERKKNGGLSICQQLVDAGENFAMVAETNDFSFDGNIFFVPANKYYEQVSWIKGNIYFHGYWINREWLKGKCWPVLQQELQYAPIEDERNKQYLEEINNTESVMLHIRRGDFVTLHRDVPIEYYQNGIAQMKSLLPDAHYFIFSDDLEWCKNNLEILGLKEPQVTYIEGNDKGNNFRDMQLMSSCKNVMLINASSFAYLATLLNTNPSIKLLNLTGRDI